jgi:hypothetical protein
VFDDQRHAAEGHTMSNKDNQGCDKCNRSTLSLLLLRPSPIAKDARLSPVGSDGVRGADDLVAGLIPARKPAESRYVLRLLRAGYVYVFIPNPPPGVRNWLVYKVTEGADLISQCDPVFSQMPAPAACTRNGHNAAGIKLLPIPQAHKITSLWIAYSANLWGDKLKAANAANPKVMRELKLQGGSANTFLPTATALKSRVLECAVGDYRTKGASGTSSPSDSAFPFVSMSGEVENLADNLRRAAASHPKTKGCEMAVVLPDPVGVGAELNAIRLRRHQLLEVELALPENAHPLQSDAALKGLKNVFVSSSALNSYDKVSPLCTKAQFDAGKWPPDTEWAPLTLDDRLHLERLALGDNFLAYLFMTPVRTLLERPDLGRAIYPDLEQRAAAWAAQEVQKSWSTLAPHIDEAERQKWKTDFAARMKSAHGDPLLRAEEDWLHVIQAPETIEYFSRHFDPQDPNRPGSVACPGEIYAGESALIHQPAPMSAQLLEAYLKPLDGSVVSDEAVALRALMGNQESVISLVHTQLTGDPGDTGMRDKTYDFLKGVLGLDVAKPTLKKFGWLGFGVAGFATGYLSALSGAATNLLLSQSAGMTPQMQARLLKIQALWGVQRTMEVAAAGSLKGGAPSMPVLLYMKVDGDRALEVLRARAGQHTGGSRSYIKRQRRRGAKVSMALLTDTDTLRTVRGDLSAALADPGSGSLKMGAAAKATTAGVGALALTEDQFLRLYAREAGLGTKAVNALRESLHGGAALQAKTIALSLPGRLALGSVLVQGLGLINGLYALKQAGTEKEVRDAWYGIYDSTAGTMGGLLEMWAVAREATKMAVAGAALQAGSPAVAKSISIGALKFLGNVAGAAGGVVNAAGAWAKAGDAKQEGEIAIARLYLGSMVAFGGTTIASGAVAAGALADTLVARGIGGAVVESIALRVGAGGVLATVGGTALTVSGIGLVLLGAGVALQVGAVALTPTPMQRWLSRSYFGKDPSFFSWDGKRDDMFAKGDWAAEFKALQEALAEGGKASVESAKPPLTEKAKQVIAQ